MDTLILRVLLAPALIAIATLVGRRWGPGVSGWLVALPLTSGPIALLVALEHGQRFAATAAIGALNGALAEIAFCLAYVMLAHRGSLPAFLAACVSFTVVAAVLLRVSIPFVALAVLVVGALGAALVVIPGGREGVTSSTRPHWDLPLRMTMTTAVVVGITQVATALGPELSGVLAMFPAYAAVLTFFAHRAGPASATLVLRGVVVGLFAGTVFFIVLAVSIERLGVAGGFLTSTALALLVQAASLPFVTMRRVKIS